jgi:hypothetical protein
VLHLWLRLLTRRRIVTYPPICLAVSVVVGVVYSAGHPDFLGGDFRAFYTGGTFVRRHEARLLYDFAATQLFQRELVPTSPTALSAWLNPPVFAWAFVPVSTLSFVTALLVHSAAGLALGWLSLRLIHREVPALSRAELAWALAMYWPTAQWLSTGQTTGIWLLIYTAVYVFLRRGGDAMAGLALGCMTWKPQLGVGLGVLLLAGRRARAIASATGTALVWGALSYCTLPEATREYVRRLPTFSDFFRSEGYPTAGLHGLYQQGPLLLDGISPHLGTALGLLLTSLGLVALFAMWRNVSWAPGTASWDLAMAASIALSVLVSPHLFGYDRTLFIVPFAIVSGVHARGTAGRPLDGGPILGLPALVWVLGMLGPALTVAQQWITKAATGRSAAIQPDVIATLTWIAVVYRKSRAIEANSSSPSARRAARAHHEPDTRVLPGIT